MNNKQNLIVGQHYPAIDGLRGLAVLLVLWFHSSYFVTIDMDQPLSGMTYGYYLLTILGETGVDLFFVLSGFLITGILIDTAQDQHVLKNFYIRRSLRIFPLYYTVLFAFLVYFLFIFGMDGLDHVKIFTHLFYVQNWSLSHNKDQFILLDHTWSLAVEEQFYLFWPALFLLFYEKGNNLRHVIYLCLSMVFLSWWLRIFFMDLNQHKLAYTLTISRLDGLALGALLSIACIHYRGVLLEYRSIFPIVISFLLLFLMMVLFSNDVSRGAHHDMTRIGLMICTTLYVSILAHVFLSDDSALIKRCLVTFWLRSVGKYSYGMYIFHSPVMMIIVRQLYYYDLGYWKSHLILLLSGTMLSFAMSFISYHLLEKRMLRLKNKYAPLGS